MADRRTRCACDACPELLGPHDAVTPEGFCGFCARKCYPPTTVGGVLQRMQLVPAERASLHDLLERYGTVEPDEVRRIATLKTGVALAQAAGPYVLPHVPKRARTLLAVLAKRLSR